MDAKASGVAEAKTSALADAKAGSLADAKASSLADAKASALVDAKAGALLDAKTSSLLDAKTGALVDAKTGGILDGAWNGNDLWHYVPVVTIGFASYRAWRRAEGGTRWGRNLEFAATEVRGRRLFGRSFRKPVGIQIEGKVALSEPEPDCPLFIDELE